ncbi:carbohydrate ABC transporter permease [Streptomyces purpurogeneiscleroticus]|uniref:carbohydrate ABC transporter permease n=1 Tax=Streptomyces purpurogeneiscleroticus TaxID=68259 RepID=UPI001CBC0423|nr:sugar ABC transporter permease [Streptomyces purpurogeneiscleroticus]MBZ4016074.1 ABC transporter permease [Streptomyces purpurogeneiscleroticus]
MSAPTLAHDHAASPESRHRDGRRRRPRRPIRGREGLWGWIFASPLVTVLGLFLLVPILMAVWVSLLDWNGQSNPFTSSADFVGLDNYTDLLLHDGLDRQQFMTAVRNNLYYVLLVVPLQTIVSLGLALAVNQRLLRARGLFRTAFYFPSVTSSIAISTVFLFLFQGGGTVNTLLGMLGIDGPNWFTDARGLTWVVLDALGLVDSARPPAALAGHELFGLPWSEWLAGPSVAMCTIIALAVWTTSGTFMLIFLAALQDVPAATEEAARIDGANRWQVFRHVTLPALRPVVFLVLTLGLIGTWQVFDQVYVMSQGAPGNTTLTPAYLSYTAGFNDGHYGKGAAIAFVLLAVIVALTLVQRWLLRERDGSRFLSRTTKQRRTMRKADQ